MFRPIRAIRMYFARRAYNAAWKAYKDYCRVPAFQWDKEEQTRLGYEVARTQRNFRAACR